MYITDDGVSRWSISFEENGYLKPNDKLIISESCVFALNRIKFFICPNAYFRKIISKVLERRNFEIFDASTVLDILPSVCSGRLFGVFENLDNLSGHKIRVLFQTKDSSWLTFLAVLRSAFRRNPPVRLEFFVFLQGILGRTNVDVTYLSPLPPEAYNSLVAICTHVSLQDRGGASTARLYLKMGARRSAHPSSVPELEYSSWDEVIAKVTQRSSREVIMANAQTILGEENRSLHVLSSIYC
ncbi:hypothetical protein [Salinisphaera hydrothermalis]|uniref:hypothetical protein n=1 Tax=Salinisphaera hydrothermalis TaxID=563188 RepID=UPI00334030D5